MQSQKIYKPKTQIDNNNVVLSPGKQVRENDDTSPIPALTSLYHQSKKSFSGSLYRNRNKDLIFTQIKNILALSDHPDFDGFSLSSLLASVVNFHGNWQDLVNKDVDKKIVELIRQQIPGCNGLDFSRTFWSLSQLGLKWSDLIKLKLDALFIKALQEKIKVCNAKDLVNILVAISTMGITWLKLRDVGTFGYTYAKMLDGLMTIAKDLDSIGVCSVLLRLERMGASWKDLSEAKLIGPLMEAVRRNIRHFTPRNVSNILVAFAHFNLTWAEIKKHELARDIFKQLRDTLATSQEQDISNTLWALVSMGVTWEELKREKLDKLLLEAVKRNASKLPEQGISNIFWALSHLRVTTTEIKEIPNLNMDLVNAIERNADEIAKEEKNVIQVLIAQKWYGFKLKPEVQRLLDDTASTQLKPKSSNLHKLISARIKKMTCEDIEDEYCYDGLLWVDMYLLESNIVIEIDGPDHVPFLDKFKEDLLLQLGVKKVIRIKYTDNYDEISLEHLLRKHNIKIDFNSERKPRKMLAKEEDDRVLTEKEETPAQKNIAELKTLTVEGGKGEEERYEDKNNLSSELGPTLDLSLVEATSIKNRKVNRPQASKHTQQQAKNTGTSTFNLFDGLSHQQLEKKTQNNKKSQKANKSQDGSTHKDAPQNPKTDTQSNNVSRSGKHKQLTATTGKQLQKHGANSGSTGAVRAASNQNHTKPFEPSLGATCSKVGLFGVSLFVFSVGMGLTVYSISSPTKCVP